MSRHLSSDILVIVDNYIHADLLPVVAAHGETAVVFCDHRTTPKARAAVIAPLARDLGVASFDVSISAPASIDCRAGYHDWHELAHDRALLLDAVGCARCGAVEWIEPVPTPHIERYQLMAS